MRPRAASPTRRARPGTGSSATARSRASCRSSACTAGRARSTTTSSRSSELAATGRRVVFYDQIGCGKSWVEKPADFWTVELFVAEVQAVRDALGLDRIHLFGSSWGGMLAMEYALTQPAGLASLVLSSSPPSIPVWDEETGRLRRELPAEVQAVLDEHEAAGTLDSPEYEAAAMEFYKRHVCRRRPVARLRPSARFTGLAEHPDVYLTMQGPNEFVITGTLKDWDITGRLGEIDVPTLITAGATTSSRRARRDAHDGHRRLRAGHVRGQLAHAVRRGARALPRGRRRLPRPRRAAGRLAAWRASTRRCST